MKTLSSLIWIEQLKAMRSKMPLYTALGSLVMPLGIAFLLFVSKNPEISRKLGLISTKATLMADTAANWPTYLETLAQILAMGGMILFVMIISWVFGREFTDGTLKDLLAVPVQRLSILLAKFIVVSIWFAALALLIFGIGIFIGIIFQLPQGSTAVLLQGSARAAITAGLVILAMMPFAFFASLGRGYLLPIGAMILAMILANLVMAAGWGEYFPWAVVAIYSQGKEILPPLSFLTVGITGLASMIGTYVWWMYADQNR
ncbi:MAG: ABC transporter permease [Chloroflexota bacterium]